ncbi:MAG TPA: inorganic diphosphatase [Methylococcaceae bacterium]|jgi:inorganic pyrophosphatase|nr:inorganic diphosphatase [Methylococcaceae bacterium]
MALMKVSSGKNVPSDINVIIEIPAYSDPVKYEVDKDTGALFVDRFMGTAMQYPCNYGYVPHSLSEDGDPVDVLVIAPSRLLSGSVVRCRPIGLLKMADESGSDAKVLAVPADKLTPLYGKVSSFRDIAELQLAQIAHFFEHYKDLEPGKWVKIEGWFDAEEAKQEIMESIERYNHAKKKPNF